MLVYAVVFRKRMRRENFANPGWIDKTDSAANGQSAERDGVSDQIQYLRKD
jgi:hypothetical protein